MHELIDLAKFDLVVRVVGLAGLPMGVFVGALVGQLRGEMRWHVSRGAAIGLLGPIIYGLWRYYRWTVRLEPTTGYVGLHKFSTLLMNVAVFAVVGIILGWVYGRILHRRDESADKC